MDINFQLKMHIRSEWGNIGNLHETVWNLTQTAFQNPDLSDRVAMVCAEILENAVRHNETGEGEREDLLYFSLRCSTSEAIVEVRNRIQDPESEDLRVLDETIQWVRGFQNPNEAYMDALNCSFESGACEHRMGIVRIAYEGNASCDFYMNEKDEIYVSAVIPLD